jgi:hypothetical protein
MVSEPPRVSLFWVKGIKTPWANAEAIDLSTRNIKKEMRGLGFGF